MTKIGPEKIAFNDLPFATRCHLAPKILGENAQFPYLEEEINETRYLVEANALKTTEAREELSSPEGRHLEKLIQEVLGVKLLDSAKEDPEEKRRLELCKERIRQYVAKVLRSVKAYMGTILHLEEAAKRGYKVEIADADDKRKLSHNALIDDISLLNRSLKWWFGNFDPSVLPESQVAMYEKQEETLISHQIERVDVPQNGICPDNFHIANRTEITRWAKGVYKDLIQIQRLSGLVD